MRELKEYFTDAAGELRDHHLSTFPTDPPEHVFSGSFENSMRRMIRQERMGQRGARRATFFRQAAGFVLAASLGLSACVVSVGAWSGRFFEMVLEKYPAYTNITFALGGEETKPLAALTYELTVLPEGFRRVSHGSSRDGFLNYARFENDEEKYISFDQNMADAISINLDTEGVELEEIQLTGKTAKLVEKRGVCTILWNDDQYCYMVSTSLAREEAIRLAQGVRLKAFPYPTMQQLPIESLPEQYPESVALESGDVVFSQGEPQNLQKLTDFITSCNEKDSDEIRLVQYVGENAIICDLETSDGRIYYTRDEHRLPTSEQPWELGEEYESVSLLEGGGKKVLLLHTRRYEDPVEVVQF